MLRSRGWVGGVLLVSACGPAAASSNAGESTGGTTSAAADATTSIGSAATTTASSTSSETTTSATVGTTTETTGTSSETGTSLCTAAETTTAEPPSVCDPQPMNVVAYVDFDISFPNGDGEIVLDAQCVVESVVQATPILLRIEMTCDERGQDVARAVEVASDPPVALPVVAEDEVHLQAAEVVPIDTGAYECVALRDGEGSLIVGQYQTRCPAELVDPTTWLAPIALELRTDVCEPEPYEPPEDCTFIQDPCPGQDQRAAFEVTIEGAPTLVFDHGSASIADLDIRVPVAYRHYPLDAEFCGPRPYDYGSIVVQRLPF